MQSKGQCCNLENESAMEGGLVRRSSCSQSEEASNERDLPSDVVLRQPPDLSLANHVYSLNSLKRTPRRVKGSEALTGSDPPFDGSMILFNNIIQIADGSTATPATEFAGLLQLCDDLRIRRVSIHIDHPRPGMARRTQCLLKEAFGRSRVPSGAQEEVDGRTCGIDRTVQIRPFAGDA